MFNNLSYYVVFQYHYTVLTGSVALGFLCMLYVEHSFFGVEFDQLFYVVTFAKRK